MVVASVVAVPALVRAQQRPGPLPILPLTQLDERGLAADLDSHAFTLTFAQPVPIGELLLLLVRGTNLSMVPDPGITGTFIGELKNISVRQALALILRPLSLDYSVDGTVVRVFRREAETRLFDLDYIASQRVGTSTLGGGAAGRGAATISTTTKADVFDDLAKGVRSLLTDKATFNIDRKAGLLQVTDFPERLDRVALYLDAVQDRANRQAQIDVRVIEVDLNDATVPGIDWAVIAAQLVGTATPAQRAAATAVADRPARHRRHKAAGSARRPGQGDDDRRHEVVDVEQRAVARQDRCHDVQRDAADCV